MYCLDVHNSDVFYKTKMKYITKLHKSGWVDTQTWHTLWPTNK